MIAVLVRDLRWRLLAVALLSVILYFLEPSFHQHEVPTAQLTAELGPLGIAATLAYLSGLSMIILLGGFVSTDRREGYSRLFFSHPTSPLAFYSLKWGVALALSLGAALAFLLMGQLVAWRGFHGGAQGLLLALLAALVYGGLMAFLSTALPRGDGWIAFLLFFPTFLPPQLFDALQLSLSPSLYRAVLFVLPPQAALTDVYQGLLLNAIDWTSVLFVFGYAAVWIIAAVVLLRVREWE